MCKPDAPPLRPADLAHLRFRRTLSSSQRKKAQLHSDALCGATSGWFAACGLRLSSVGVIYDIFMLHGVMVVQWASLRSSPAGMRECPAPISKARFTRAAAGPRMVTDSPCGEFPGIRTGYPDAGSKV